IPLTPGTRRRWELSAHLPVWAVPRKIGPPMTIAVPHEATRLQRSSSGTMTSRRRTGMDSQAGLISWDEQEIGRYVEERRQALDDFLRECFSFRGTCNVFWRTLRSDLLRHPLNFILAIPKLLITRIAGVMEKFGRYSLARRFQRLSLVLRSGFENAREEQIVGSLIGASDEAEIRGALEGPLSHFRRARPAFLELARGAVTMAVAYALFGRAVLSPYEMGQRLAAPAARERASSRFFLGRGVGSAFYHFFPPHPTWGQIATS